MFVPVHFIIAPVYILSYVATLIVKITLNVKNFTLRVRSGDIYFSLGKVLTLNVKNDEDLKRNMTAKKYQWSYT